MSKLSRDRYRNFPESFELVYVRYILYIIIWKVYACFIPGIYLTYIISISIFQVYTWYMAFLLAYTRYLLGICWVYAKYIPGGWCCGGGHDPLPPEPPAITSPGLVITVILLDSPPLHILLLLMWMCTALLYTKNDGKPRFSHEQHTKGSIWVSTDNPYGTKAGILRRG